MAKSQRKSRSPKIDVGHAEPLEYIPSDKDWELMEKALGKTVPNNTRAQIKIIIGRYFKERQFEVNAPSKKDVLNHIRRLKNSADILQKLLKDAEIGSYRNAARTKIAAVIGSSEIFASLESELLPRLIAGAELAAENVGAAARGPDGEAWQQMASEMKSLFESSELPFGAPHDGNKGEASPFVRFFIQLQKSFPTEIPGRHYNGSPATLAKEINRAVKARSALSFEEDTRQANKSKDI